MKALWKRYLAWFAALKSREQKIIALAVLLGGSFLGFSYGIEPALIKAKRDSRAAREATAATAPLQQQVSMLQSATVDPDAPLRAQLEKLRGDLATQGQRFAEVESSLVPPQRMTALLESMLARNAGLQLLSLRTLPAAPVIERKAAAEGKDKALPAVGAKADAAAAVLAGAPNLYKHGVELKVAGTYAELLAYVSALENAPQRLLWGRMDIVAEDYPRSQMTLTVFTLSLDKSWLVL